jgi:tRNA-dihydrouridine synthase B
MKIGSIELASPFAMAPMAGMTDTSFRRLVKRHGGCGLVVTEMVSSEGLVRGIDRTLEYAEFTEEERPVSVQIFGGNPDTMAAAAVVVEHLGADIVDVNMGCPVPKIARHNAGCSLMREPEQAASIVGAMAKAVKIPVTVKMRAGWNEGSRNAPELARMVQDAGAAAISIHGRTAEQAYSGRADWDLVAQVADSLRIPVLGSGDCVEPDQVLEKLAFVSPTGFPATDRTIAGVLVGRGVLRNPWILAQAADLAAGRAPGTVTKQDRALFLLEYIELLLNEGIDEAEGFRHVAASATRVAGSSDTFSAPGYDSSAWPESTRVPITRGRERWVINKLRALCTWYSKGFDGGSHLRMRVNAAQSIPELREIIHEFFVSSETGAPLAPAEA